MNNALPGDAVPADAPKIRVAVAGCGIGSRQARIFGGSPAYRLVSVCDVDPSRAATLAATLGVGDVMEDFGELCARENVNVISICTPPALHFEHITRALRAGKNVICEKPLVGSLHELDEITALARHVERWVMPIFQLRFGSGANKLRRLMERGVTGPLNFATVETAWTRGVEYYQTNWRRTWRGSLGGCLLGHAVHAHDLLCHLGGRAAEVFAFAETRINPVETEDCAVGAVRFASGALASTGATLGSFAEISRLRFCFRHLTAESNTHPYETSGDPWTFTAGDPRTSAAMREALADFTPEPEGYAGQFHHLQRSLVEKTALPVTLEDARESIELATAFYYSIATGRGVPLPIPKDHPFYRGWLGDLETKSRPNGSNHRAPPGKISAV